MNNKKKNYNELKKLIYLFNKFNKMAAKFTIKNNDLILFINYWKSQIYMGKCGVVNIWGNKPPQNIFFFN